MIAAIYNHPFDYTITNMIPFLIGSILLGKMYAFTYFMWGVYVSIFGDLIHCGYDFPWFPWSAFPFGAETSHHDYHHSSNIGSYGVFSTFFDTICRTNKHYIKSIIEKDKKT